MLCDCEHNVKVLCKEILVDIDIFIRHMEISVETCKSIWKHVNFIGDMKTRLKTWRIQWRSRHEDFIGDMENSMEISP